jgi:hypothetical protein
MSRVQGDKEKWGRLQYTIERNGVRGNLKASASASARRAAIPCRKLSLTPLFATDGCDLGAYDGERIFASGLQ